MTVPDIISFTTRAQLTLAQGDALDEHDTDTMLHAGVDGLLGGAYRPDPEELAAWRELGSVLGLRGLRRTLDSARRAGRALRRSHETWLACLLGLERPALRLGGVHDLSTATGAWDAAEALLTLGGVAHTSTEHGPRIEATGLPPRHPAMARITAVNARLGRATWCSRPDASTDEQLELLELHPALGLLSSPALPAGHPALRALFADSRSYTRLAPHTATQHLRDRSVAVTLVQVMPHLIDHLPAGDLPPGWAPALDTARPGTAPAIAVQTPGETVLLLRALATRRGLTLPADAEPHVIAILNGEGRADTLSPDQQRAAAWQLGALQPGDALIKHITTPALRVIVRAARAGGALEEDVRAMIAAARS